MIASLFEDRANLVNVDNELWFLFDLELVKVRTFFRFYTIALSFEDKANLSDVD